MEHLAFIFVHGLSGWGSYDEAYARMPYWGMRGGDLLKYLGEHGFACYAASVSPTGSAWDRACELYAQLAGTRVDYGSVHSERYRHARFGKDYSACPLLKEWNEKTRLVLLGHSFGGATVRLFSEFMANGAQEERETSPAGDISPLFAGGMASRIHSIVTLASPMNGTTAYDLFEDTSFQPEKVNVPLWSRWMARIMRMGIKWKKDGRDSKDWAGYDMHVDRALEMNRLMTELPNVYYFSVPCSWTHKTVEGVWKPNRGMEPLFVMRSNQIGAYTGVTRGGTEIGESWLENDGLVNTCSAAFPFYSKHKPFDREHAEPGMWNVFPIYEGDHMSLQGGLQHRRNIRPFYLDLLKMIRDLPDALSL
ncbi:MAG: hypothetical protein K6A68_15230 [Clostridiales bacterium]|nr:hypothetical protein [Clostridiales bacterium]